MPRLFRPTKINRLALPNRFRRSATWEGLAAENGDCTPELVDLISDLAGGNPGLIITGRTYVNLAGQATPRQMGVDHDGRIKYLSAMTAAVHRKRGRIMMQLAHGGLRDDMKFSLDRKAP